MKKKRAFKQWLIHLAILFTVANLLFLIDAVYTTSFEIITGAFKKSTGAVILLLIVSVLLSLGFSFKILPKLQRRFLFDSLTGVYNKRAGLSQLHKLYDTAKFQSRPLSLCLICIDNFKKVTELLGSGVAEQLIIGTRDGIQTHIRRTDLIIRISDSEFLIALINVNAVKAQEIWQRIDKEYLFYNDTGIKPFVLSISAKIAECGFGHDEDAETVIQSLS